MASSLISLNTIFCLSQFTYDSDNCSTRFNVCHLDLTNYIRRIRYIIILQEVN